MPALLALYFLKLRRQPRVVPSTLLWKKAVEDLEVNAPFQKLRNSVLLWLQLLLLLLLVFAIARPASDAPAPTGDRVVILIDRSASMSVEEAGGGRTRLEVAKETALGVLDAMEPGAAAMVAAFADEPEVLQPFSADRGRLRTAIGSVRGSDRPGRPGRALALVSAQAGAAGEGAASVYLLGDSPAEPAGERPDAPLPVGAELRYLAIGGDPGNLGFTAIGARRGLRDPQRVELFARLENASPAAVETNVTLDSGGDRLATRRVRVPARGSDGVPGRRDLEMGFAAPPGEAAALTLAHDRADALAADDAARLVLPGVTDRPVVLVTPGGNPFLERAVRAAATGEVRALSPEAWASGEALAAPGAVVVFDRHAPAEVPPQDALFFAAVPPVPGLGLRESAADAPAVQSFLTWDATDPVMRSVGVGLGAVPLVRPGRLVLPPEAEVLASGLEGPLIARIPAGASGGGRFLVVAPDPLQGRWPLSVSFAVFVVNALDDLAAPGSLGVGGGGLAFHTGAAPAVPPAPGTSPAWIRYEGPTPLSAPVRGGVAVFPALERAGWYRADDPAAVAPGYERLAVNLASPSETDLRPPASLDLGPGRAAAAVSGGAATVRRSWVPWILAAAVVLLLAEWFVYTGRFAPAAPLQGTARTSRG